MAENLSLTKLAIAATDEVCKIRYLQKLIEISLEQFDYPTDDTSERVQILLGTYIPDMNLRLEELELALSQMRSLIGATPKDSEDG